MLCGCDWWIGGEAKQRGRPRRIKGTGEDMRTNEQNVIAEAWLYGSKRSYA